MREKPPRVVLDTNLFASALISPTGTPNQLLQLWEQGGIILLTSGELIHEVDSVLHRDYIKERYHLAEEQIQRLLTRLHLMGEWVIPLGSPLPLHSRDPKDDPLLALALGGNADYLITGDTDLLVLDGDPALGSLPIITATAFLEQLDL